MVLNSIYCADVPLVSLKSRASARFVCRSGMFCLSQHGQRSGAWGARLNSTATAGNSRLHSCPSYASPRMKLSTTGFRESYTQQLVYEMTVN